MAHEEDLDRWFVREILPLEPGLVRFIRNNWRNESEIEDLRQETYLRLYEAAARERPAMPKPFLYQTARNLMISRLRHANVVPIETMADLEEINVLDEEPTPERQAAGRQQIRLLQTALAELPAGLRQVFSLRKIEGLRQREVALRLGLSEENVEAQLARGLRLVLASLADRRGALLSHARRSARMFRIEK